MRTVDLRSVDSASNILSGYEISANGDDSSAVSITLSFSKVLSLAFSKASRGVSFYSTSPVSFLALEHVFPASYRNREEETLRPPIRTVKWSRFSVCLCGPRGRADACARRPQARRGESSRSGSHHHGARSACARAPTAQGVEPDERRRAHSRRRAGAASLGHPGPIRVLGVPAAIGPRNPCSPRHCWSDGAGGAA